MVKHKRAMTMFLLLILLCACGAGEQQDEVERPRQDVTVIGVSFPMTYLAYRERMLSLLVETYGDSDTVELRIYDAEGSQKQQNHDILDMVAQGVDGIMLMPNTMEGPLSVVQYAGVKGIDVITVDNRIEDSSSAEVVSFVGADHTEMGRQAAELLLAELERSFPDEEHWNVIELTGIAQSSGALDRGMAILQALEGNSRVNLLGRYNASFTTENAKAVISDCLQVYDSIHGIICQNDLMALGCYQALDEAGMAGDVVVVGIDGQRDVVELIAQGGIAGTVLQSPDMILDGMERLLAHLNGEQIESIYTQPTYPVTRENAADYLRQNLVW